MKKRLLAIIFIILFFTYRSIAQNYSPVWVNDIAGGGGSSSTAVALDKSGDVYITGRFAGTAIFNLKQGGNQTLTSNGGADIFLAKYDPVAGNYIWAIGFGGAADEHPTDMVIDNSGNVLIIGQYASTINFNPKGSDVLTPVGAEDIFFAKYTAAGDFVWAKSIGESETDRGVTIATDNNNNVFIAGLFENTMNADPNGGNYSLVSNNGNYCQFFGKYDSSGNLVWAHPLPGGFNVSPGTRVVTDPNTGDVVVGGVIAYSFDFSYNSTSGATISPSSQGNFIAKYTNAGVYEWVKYLPGSGSATCNTLLVNPQSNILLDAVFGGTFYPGGEGSTQLTSIGSSDAALVSYSGSGTLQWVDQFGGNGGSFYGDDICLDGTGEILMGGSFSGSINFNPAGSATLSSSNGEAFFISKYDALGKSILYSGFGGGCESNVIYRLVSNSAGVYITGGFCATNNFNPSSCATDNLTASGPTDAFVAKYIISSSVAGIGDTIKAPADTNFYGNSSPESITGNLASGNGYTYQWQSSTDDKNFNNIPGATSQNYTTLSLTNTTYFRRILSNGTCGSTNSNVVTITVNNFPPKPLTVCAGNTTTLTGDTINPAPNSYLWQILQNNIWSTAINPNDSANYQTPVLINNTGANTEVDYRRQSVTGSDTAYDSYYDITVLPQLTNNTVTNPETTVFCSSGDPGNLAGNTPTGGTGTYTYQWQTSADGVTFTNITGATGTSYDPPTLFSTTYYQRLVMSGTCGVLASNIIIISIVQPPAPLNSIVTQTCTNTSANITINNAQAGLTYNWYGSANRTNLLYTGTTYTTDTLKANTTFYIEAVNGPCSSPALAAVQVNVTPLPGEPMVNNSIVKACSGTQLTLSIVNPQAGYTYNWYTNASGGIPAGTGVDFVTPILSETITYYAEAVNTNGCISAMRTPVAITVSQPPDISAQGAPACPGTSAVLTAFSIDPTTTINWYADASGGSVLFSGSSFTTPDLTANTSYYAEAVDTYTGCISSSRAVAMVTILMQLATPVVTVESTSPSAITFQWTAVPNAGGYKVSIDNGVTFTDPSSGSDGLSTTLSGLQTNESITIIVEAVGSYDCQTSNKSNAVTAIAQYPQNDIIYVANAFTPNGDGKNDVVYVHGDGIQSMNFHVYDQFGELIFTSTSLSTGWDGTYKGTKQPVGVYVYYVQAVMYNGQSISKKGTITLLR